MDGSLSGSGIPNSKIVPKSDLYKVRDEDKNRYCTTVYTDMNRLGLTVATKLLVNKYLFRIKAGIWALILNSATIKPISIEFQSNKLSQSHSALSTSLFKIRVERHKFHGEKNEETQVCLSPGSNNFTEVVKVEHGCI